MYQLSEILGLKKKFFFNDSFSDFCNSIHFKKHNIKSYYVDKSVKLNINNFCFFNFSIKKINNILSCFNAHIFKTFFCERSRMWT